MQTAAAPILKRALEMEANEQYTMALVLYQEGLKILVDSIKDIEDPMQKKYFRTKASEYMDRAEKIKSLIDERKAAGKYREQTKIADGATGYGYASLFGRFLEASVTDIHIEDPYIRSFHQCQNLVRFCELAVQKCPSLLKVSLITNLEPNEEKFQKTRLKELKQSLLKRKVTLDFSFSTTLHDRQIKLSNGWIIKMGRGLDYFYPPDAKCALGFFDLELRACRQTEIDIFHNSQLQQKAD